MKKLLFFVGLLMWPILFISNNPYVAASVYTTSLNSTTKTLTVNQSGVYGMKIQQK